MSCILTVTCSELTSIAFRLPVGAWHSCRGMEYLLLLSLLMQPADSITTVAR